MSFKQGLILGVVFLVIALAGSAGISYAVVELAGAEGPQGEQGPPGERGPGGGQGPRGLQGASGADALEGTGLRSFILLLALKEARESDALGALMHDMFFPDVSSTAFQDCLSSGTNCSELADNFDFP